MPGKESRLLSGPGSWCHMLLYRYGSAYRRPVQAHAVQCCDCTLRHSTPRHMAELCSHLSTKQCSTSMC